MNIFRDGRFITHYKQMSLSFKWLLIRKPETLINLYHFRLDRVFTFLQHSWPFMGKISILSYEDCKTYEFRESPFSLSVSVRVSVFLYKLLDLTNSSGANIWRHIEYFLVAHRVTLLV